MTPAARIQAAIDILDAVLGGAAAEQSLTTWARKSRYAGAADRAAVRDHVFDALRCRRSHAWLGGAETGRGLMIGALRAAGHAPGDLFTGVGYGPAPLASDEIPTGDLSEAPEGVRLDMPDWLLPELQSSLRPDCGAICDVMRARAPVFLRCNLRSASRAVAAAVLRRDGIETRPHSLAGTALEVTANPRRIQASQAFSDGLVELQDAASQAVVEALPLRDGAKVLDFCAGGGGKALAMAARANLQVTAHDANPARLRDLPGRAKRAAAAIDIRPLPDVQRRAPYDLVLCDAPCSGSGAWRRSPDAKWRLTRQRLADLRKLQAQILDQAAALVQRGGHLAYATCSLLDSENSAQVAAFIGRTPGWRLTQELRLTPLDGGDGFYLGLLTRALQQS
ncbi:MAG: RsmB/NOP family class I SAM-dependent RNA methyltransferase [Rhodobacter sp.]|nr:RsmB/NOP family class I SAM-dependent RNA methyltransferase [Rhodobacter sp.]